MNLSFRFTGWLFLARPLLQLSLGAALPAFDFTQPEVVQTWQAQHDISSLRSSATGMVAQISGSDPYLAGPARDYPANTPLWLRLRLKADQAGTCQVFYFSTAPSEANSVKFAVPANTWTEGRVPVPPLGKGYRLRIDPPGVGGQAVLAFLKMEERSALPDFDFTTVPDATAWQAAHDVSALQSVSGGLNIGITGSDPYIYGPARDYPANTPLWMNIRLKSDQGGMAQVFYFTTGATEANSVRFAVPASEWYDTRVPLASLGPGWRLRIDPPGAGGNCILGSLRFEARETFAAPAWPVVDPPRVGANDPALANGALQLRHHPGLLGGFEVWVAGQRLAVGNSQMLLGYQGAKGLTWLDMRAACSNHVSVAAQTNRLEVTAQGLDADGASWLFQQVFSTANLTNLIAVETRVSTSQDRRVVYLPMLNLFAGLGSFQTNKTQGLFAGLEYLDNEPSSSEADLIGPAAKRQVPDTLKLTFPLMAIAADQRYVGLAWASHLDFSPVFDSPDRIFNSGGHLMGLVFPGSNGQNREEGSLLPYGGELLAASQILVSRAWLMGGPGASLIPAVQQFVQLNGLPPLPDTGYDSVAYAELAAHGWLDSQIRSGNQYRHAAWPGFDAQPAADAAFYMDWLAGQVRQDGLPARLKTAAKDALSLIQPSDRNATTIGHIRFPVPALVYGAVAENADHARAAGRSLLARFQPDGTVLYQAPAGGVDYGKTHFARDANGLTAQVVASLLEAAAYSGDASLQKEGLRVLQGLDKFSNTVPRGAQTWEIPLHTPDILASAYLVRAYTLGYELSGYTRFLDQARYWAWTGVPFVYLVSPVAKPVGPYSTIPVLGATGWTAPIWIGLPVQWCGMVYADALHRFAPYDPAGPWRQLANGITAAGLQHTWPRTDADRQGLLPDSYQLRAQLRDGPPINPATMQAGAVRLYGRGCVYDFKSFLRHGLLVHAPGRLTILEERADGIRFQVSGWPDHPYWILVNGVRQTPRVLIQDQELPLAAPHVYQASEGRLILQLQGSPVVEIKYPARAALQLRNGPGFGQVQIQWPATASNFVLQAATELDKNAAWINHEQPAQTSGSQFVVTESTANRKFYRLQHAE